MALTKFPGFIDAHVHLRDPGATHKEDFYTGSRAGVKGGFTFLLDMPNNYGVPTITPARLQEKIQLSNQKAICDIGFHYGTDGTNLNTFSDVWNNPHVFGLKIYCSHTTGELLIEKESVLDSVFCAWSSHKPILVHAEEIQLDICLSLASKYERRLHVCHLSDAQGVGLVRKAKEKGQPVTAGVTPHHLYLTKSDLHKLAGLAEVKPPIEGDETQVLLWEALKDGTIDIVESDHAPHTREEKISDHPAFGVPGLETTVGLLMRSVAEGTLKLEDVVTFLYDRPKKIFEVPDQRETFIELDPKKHYIAGENGYETKCGWSPFDGWELYGKIERVVLRGKPLVVDGAMV